MARGKKPLLDTVVEFRYFDQDDRLLAFEVLPFESPRQVYLAATVDRSDVSFVNVLFKARSITRVEARRLVR